MSNENQLSVKMTEEKPLIWDRKDWIFAAVYFLVGYGFIYVFTSEAFERNLSIFTVFYGAAVLAYLAGKGKRPARESYFWLAVMLAVGLPFGSYSVFYVLQVLALIFAAAYWTLSASGRLMEGKTSRWFFFDAWNSMVTVPFGNFTCQLRIFFGLDSKGRKEKGKTNQGLSVLLGVGIAVPVLIIVLPLLSNADAGFERIVGALISYIQRHLLMTVIRISFALPTAAYLFGLAYGGISGRNTDKIQKEAILLNEGKMKKVPGTAVFTALGLVCLVYVLFMGVQGNYLFSAFRGKLPGEFTYAEYARRGFFELCEISVINLLLLGAGAMFTKKDSEKGAFGTVITVLLSLLTLLMIATDMSKMGMYIRAYGLTVNRIVTMVFMLWLAIIFFSVILRQKKEFPLIRRCVMAGAVLFSLMCVLPVEHLTEIYNTWARLQGLIP